MALTLQNIRDHVRTSLDVDATDIPDAILDQWIRDGWRRVIRRVRRWPFMEKLTTFNTAGGTANYTYATINANCEEIIDLNGPNWRIRQKAPELAERVYPRSYTGQGEPVIWSRWQDTVTLWPTPGAIYSIQVRYYEKPIEWVNGGASSTPSQLPDDFHDLIAIWALHRAHAQQEDLDLAAYQKKLFDENLETLRKAFEHRFVDNPLILGGDSDWPNSSPARLTYPFE